MFRNWYGLFVHFFITGFAEIGLLACHFLILSTFLWLRTLWDSTIWILIQEQGCQYNVAPEKSQLGSYPLILKLQKLQFWVDSDDSLPFSVISRYLGTVRDAQILCSGSGVFSILVHSGENTFFQPVDILFGPYFVFPNTLYSSP